jgi:hypothetical protein
MKLIEPIRSTNVSWSTATSNGTLSSPAGANSGVRAIAERHPGPAWEGVSRRSGSVISSILR